jgi:hypothetical protein
MKWFNYVVIITGLSSAIVQWNDPDPIIWIIAYLGITTLAVFDLTNRSHKFFTVMLFTAYLIAFLTYLPDALQWIQDGMPSVVESMKAESMYIELVREAGGLLLCLTCTFVYFYSQIIKSRSASL